MCLDPHAVAKIKTREALDCMERILVEMAATNTGLSSAGLVELARLKRRLEWCDESYSRHRSQILLVWIHRLFAELVIRVIGPSICLLVGCSRLTEPHFPRPRRNRRWNNDDN